MPADERQTFTISPRPPFRLDFCAWALRRRATNLVDRWDGTTYRRVVAIDARPAAVAPHQPRATKTPPVQGTPRGSRAAPPTPASREAPPLRLFGLRDRPTALPRVA